MPATTGVKCTLWLILNGDLQSINNESGMIFHPLIGNLSYTYSLNNVQVPNSLAFLLLRIYHI